MGSELQDRALPFESNSKEKTQGIAPAQGLFMFKGNGLQYRGPLFRKYVRGKVQEMDSRKKSFPFRMQLKRKSEAKELQYRPF